MKKFRKKPVVIEAVQWTGKWSDLKELFPIENASLPMDWNRETNEVIIHTLEGDMVASVGDWLIKGVRGEVYPCKPDIFEMTYVPEPDYEGINMSDYKQP